MPTCPEISKRLSIQSHSTRTYQPGRLLRLNDEAVGVHARGPHLFDGSDLDRLKLLEAVAEVIAERFNLVEDRHPIKTDNEVWKSRGKAQVNLLEEASRLMPEYLM